MDLSFSSVKFICDSPMSSVLQSETALANFLVAKMKMQIYKTRKKKVEGGDLSVCNILLTFRTLIFSQIQLEYLYWSKYVKEQELSVSLLVSEETGGICSCSIISVCVCVCTLYSVCVCVCTV